MLKIQSSRAEAEAREGLSKSPLAVRRGVGSCKGSFGEILQGQLDDMGVDGGADFLVTLPVNVVTRATFLAQPFTSAVHVFPAWKTKTADFATKLCRELGLCGGLLSIQSEISEGKGCASSSADMTAAARAIAQTFDINIPNSLIERLALAIEPTDGVMYDDCVLYHFRTTGMKKILGRLPPMLIAALDERGKIDTLSFDSRRGSYSTAHRIEYRELLGDLSSAIEHRDLATIGRVSTRSAELHQSRLPKRNLDDLVRISEDIDAVGVIAAHSGTFVGLIFDPVASHFATSLSDALEKIASLDGDVMLFENFREHP